MRLQCALVMPGATFVGDSAEAVADKRQID